MCPHRQTTRVTRSTREGGLNSSGHVADAPAPSGDEHDRSLLRQVECPPGIAGVPWHPELRPGEAVHAMDLGCGAGDSPDLRDGLGVGDEMDVDAGTRPVVERREIGDRCADRDLQPARAAQAPEHLGDVGIGADDDIGVDLGDQPKQAGGAVARQEGLRGASRRSALREEPEADVPDELEAVEDDAGRVRAHRLDDAADRSQRVPRHDLRFGVLQVELRGEGLRGLVVSGSHAGGEDQNSRGCVRRTRGRLRFAERGRDESPFTLRDSTAPGWSLRLAPGFDVAAV